MTVKERTLPPPKCGMVPAMVTVDEWITWGLLHSILKVFRSKYLCGGRRNVVRWLVGHRGLGWDEWAKWSTWCSEVMAVLDIYCKGQEESHMAVIACRGEDSLRTNVPSCTSCCRALSYTSYSLHSAKLRCTPSSPHWTRKTRGRPRADQVFLP